MFSQATLRHYRARLRAQRLREYLEALGITALFALPMFVDALWWRP